MGKEEADPDNIVEHAGYSDESAKELEQHKAINKLDVGKDFAGPRSERKCTDVLWLLIIIAHWIAVTWLGIIAFGWVESPAIGQGRPYILTNWIDHNGWICGKEGHGGAVESKPYLYYPNPTGSEWNVALSGPSLGKLPPSGYGFCVHKCPDTNALPVFDYTSCETNQLGIEVCDSWLAYETFDFVTYCIPDGSALYTTTQSAGELVGGGTPAPTGTSSKSKAGGFAAALARARLSNLRRLRLSPTTSYARESLANCFVARGLFAATLSGCQRFASVR